MEKHLAKLEKKLAIANDIVKEFEIDEDTLPEIIEPKVTELEVINEKEVELFDMNNLKADFLLIKNNLLKLINKGQTFLDSVSIIDPSDLKASTVQAVANMHTAIGTNLKEFIGLYEKMANIEQLRMKKSNKFNNAQEGVTHISQGNTVTNQIVFSGSSDELLKIIKDNQGLQF